MQPGQLDVGCAFDANDVDGRWNVQVYCRTNEQRGGMEYTFNRACGVVSSSSTTCLACPALLSFFLLAFLYLLLLFFNHSPSLSLDTPQQGSSLGA